MSTYIKTSTEFVAGFVPPDYVIDRIFQRKFCYSMTAKTGGGKTAVAMRFAAHVATGKPIGSIEVAQGKVLYLAGENPTDVQGRWLGVCQDMGIDVDRAEVHFVDARLKLSEVAEDISIEIAMKRLQFALVVVDTVAAFYEGDDDNDNVLMGDYARFLRSLCELPGGPCVLALAHPTKRANDDDLVPKGGGAFLNEVDGNIAVRRSGMTIALEALGKFRGPDFDPVYLELGVIEDHPRLRDSKGRPMPTVVARPMSQDGMAIREKQASRDDETVLKALAEHPRVGRVELGRLIGMQPDKLGRVARRLEQAKVVSGERVGWVLTKKGAADLAALERATEANGHGALPPLPPIPKAFGHGPN